MMKLEDGTYFSFEAIGEFYADESWIHPRRVINHYELIVVLSGELNICEGGKEYILKKNEMIILEPGVEHYGIFPSKKVPRFYWFHFTTNLQICGKVFPAEQSGDIKAMLRKLLQAASTTRYAKRYTDMLGCLITDELRYLFENGARDVNALSVQVNEYIHQHYLENITIYDVAEYFGYNADYIGKIYKKDFGMSIKMQLANLKIGYAENLLLTTNKAVKEIAAELNYTDSNAFVKFFEYHKKMSPSRYRKRIINKKG